jgi:hypothetical protein
MKKPKGRHLSKIHHYVWNSPAADRELRTNSSDKKADEDAMKSTLYDSKSQRREWVAQKLLEIYRTYRLRHTASERETLKP